VNAIERMRAEFDAAFAAPRSAGDGSGEMVVAIRVAGRAYALRMSQIAGLARDRKIVAIPSPVPELLGLAGVRGELVPAYSLAAWLGHGREPTTRWLALCGTGERAGLAFGEIEGQLGIQPGQLVVGAGPDSGEHIRDWLRIDGENRPVVDVESILEGIQRRCRGGPAAKER
jgi:chemotaxis signal transduction protein